MSKKLPPVICGTCQFTCATIEEMMSHMKNEHPAEPPTQPEDKELDIILLGNSYCASPPTDVGKMFEIGMNEDGIRKAKQQLIAWRQSYADKEIANAKTNDLTYLKTTLIAFDKEIVSGVNGGNSMIDYASVLKLLDNRINQLYKKANQ